MSSSSTRRQCSFMSGKESHNKKRFRCACCSLDRTIATELSKQSSSMLLRNRTWNPLLPLWEMLLTRRRMEDHHQALQLLETRFKCKLNYYGLKKTTKRREMEVHMEKQGLCATIVTKNDISSTIVLSSKKNQLLPSARPHKSWVQNHD